MKTETFCGNCRFFDTSRNTSELDKRLSNGGKLKTGVCRADKGLILGIRIEKNNCSQNPIRFSPKSSVVSAPASSMV